MADRTYFFASIWGLDITVMQTVNQVVTSQKTQHGIFPWQKKVVTYQENISDRKKISVPFMGYLENERMYEFFSGYECVVSHKSYMWNTNTLSTLDFYFQSDPHKLIFLHFLSTGGNASVCSASDFAKAAQQWMPYKDQIIAAIDDFIRRNKQAYQNKLAAENAHKNANTDAENWLDSVLKNR